MFFDDRRLKVGLKLLMAFRRWFQLVDFRAVGLVFIRGVAGWGRSGCKDPILLRLDLRVGEVDAILNRSSFQTPARICTLGLQVASGVV